MRMADRAKMLEEVMISFAEMNATTIKAVLSAHDAIFPRYERPDYRRYPGQYCRSRIPTLYGEEIWIPSDGRRLSAHIYAAKESRGMVVFAHGIHAGADEYLPIYAYLVEAGYSVLAHNITGTYESEGDSTCGMCQSLVDMDHVLAYIEAQPAYRDIPLFVMGHSWGAYACLASLALHRRINAAAAIAPMHSATDIMFERGQQYAGSLARLAEPVLRFYQNLMYGEYAVLDSVGGINASDIPVLVAHGVDDEIISYGGTSVTAHHDEITNPRVVYYTGYGAQGDHNNIWHSTRAAAYQKEVDATLAGIETDAAAEAYLETVDHALYSEVNEDLMRAVVQLFDSTLVHNN